jgi:hydrogenase maturation protein HypF
MIQGVGFRPFVHALARRLGLGGHVGNDAAGVFIEVEGGAGAVAAFLDALASEAPALARVASVDAEPREALGDDDFSIVESVRIAGAVTFVAPDAATCDGCLRELHDPLDRRYRYPFINCTSCGPRYTIIRDLPYDRPQTAMAAFRMCAACQREYDDPEDRRFHAQPNACPACGPRVEWRPAGALEDSGVTGDSAISAALRCIGGGGVVAVKGIGGFHLACDARSDAAIDALRTRKGRTHKPFALLVADIHVARTIAHVNAGERRLLEAVERPIVLLRRREDAPIASVAAPGHDTIGVMLPYAPLHHLLAATGPLVMTSGNRSDEPIARDNAEALSRLAMLVDGFLLHDREIHMTCDDSVVRLFEGRELPVRRSRGYAPYPVALPREVPAMLAVGAELKATVCLARDRYAFLSPHIGDLGGIETLDAMRRVCGHLASLFRVRPGVVACDMHPGYSSSRWAREYAEDRAARVVEVQHHHAHVAALMAEHGLDGSHPVIGFAFDGTGYGTDGTIWGGEVMVADYRGFRRVAHLATTPLPGGDAGVRRPARIALAQLWAAGIGWDDDLAPAAHGDAEALRVLRRQLERNLNCVATSSMGRFLDAASALAGVRQEITYEGQAAIEFEALAAHGAPDRALAYRFDVEEGTGAAWRFAGGSVLAAMIADLRAGVARSTVAWRVHAAVADVIATLAVRTRLREGLTTVGLTGGVFQNVLLLGLATSQLREAGFTVLTHRLVPPNDGGIALGQAMVAAYDPDVMT